MTGEWTATRYAIEWETRRGRVQCSVRPGPAGGWLFTGRHRDRRDNILGDMHGHADTATDAMVDCYRDAVEAFGPPVQPAKQLRIPPPPPPPARFVWSEKRGGRYLPAPETETA